MDNVSANGAAASTGPVYSPTARKFHWWTALLVVIMWPLGHIMGDDNWLNLSEAARDRLTTVHKLIGFILLWLVVARLVYRFRHGAPPSESSLEPWQKAASHATHWLLYLILILMPIGGWIGVSMYGARDLYFGISLPQIAPVNEKLSEKVFALHGLGANIVLVLVLAHVGAALYHYFIRRDGVLRRMLPSLGSRGGESA